MSILIKNSMVLQADESIEKSFVADLLIENGSISQVGKVEADSAARCEEIIDGQGLLVTPGFTDTDLHSSEFLFRGEFENHPYEFRSFVSRSKSHLELISPQDRFNMALMAGSLALKHGVTAIQDHCIFSEESIDEHIQATINAYRDLGLRTTLAIEIIPKVAAPAQQTMSVTPLPNQEVATVVQRICRLSDRLIEQYHGSQGGLIQLSIVPCNHLMLDTTYQDWLRSAYARSQVRLHYHLHPTISEVNLFKSNLGLTPLQHLEKLELLNENLTASHGVWLSPEEIGLFAVHNCHLIHTPISDLNLGNGFAGLTTYLNSGAQVALGTGMGGNFNFLDVLKLTVSVHRIAQPDFDQWPSIAKVFQLGILGGAKALGLADHCGKIEPGACADLVMYNLNSLALAPLNAAKSQLVCLETGQSIHSVMVNGKFRIRNGLPRSFDQHEIHMYTSELIKTKEMVMTQIQKDFPRLNVDISDLYAQLSSNHGLDYRWTDRSINPSRLTALENE